MFWLEVAIIRFTSKYLRVKLIYKHPHAAYMNFFDHKDLGNHLLQLRPKVVKVHINMCLILDGYGVMTVF
jgi:hypothetical protein